MSKYRVLGVGKSDEWYTPPHVFAALDVEFDLDVAHPGPPQASWVPARRFIFSDSLSKPWDGFVWMNPPFGGLNGIDPWMEKFFHHGNGVALTPDRTSAGWWQKSAAKADAVLFVSRKLKFLQEGEVKAHPMDGTSLFAVGARGVAALETAQANGLGLLFYRTAL